MPLPVLAFFVISHLCGLDRGSFPGLDYSMNLTSMLDALSFSDARVPRDTSCLGKFLWHKTDIWPIAKAGQQQHCQLPIAIRTADPFPVELHD